MRTKQRSFSQTLTRSLALAGLAYAAVIAYAVPATLLSVESGQPASARGGHGVLNRVTEGLAWRPAYAKRFPDCVDMARWDGVDVPKTVVVLRRGGGLGRMTFDEAFDRATSSDQTDDVWTVGACR
ncbi:MAG TPA: hypothetical protein VFR87_02090 [Nocardioidaceae bacterium]|nr:hypothetical protein [Nocardioidaceae bacterium]